jgi:predicted transcriptional regulator
MTTSEAILKLREKLGFGQKELAQAIGVSARSVARYEAEHEPSHKVLKKLADLAESARLRHLQDFFEAKRRADIVTRVESLPSAGSERRVALDDLAEWIVKVQKISKHGKDAFHSAKDQDAKKDFHLIHSLAENLIEDMELYVAAPDKPGEITWERLQKVETILNRARKTPRED